MRFRRVCPRGLGVWALLAVLAGGPFGPLAQLHADAGDDPACEGPAATRGGGDGAAALSTPGAHAGDGHCAICHWLHALRWATLAARAASDDDTVPRSFDVVEPSTGGAGTWTRLSARAPPPASVRR